MTITHDDIYKRFLIEYDKANITSSYPSLTKHEAVAILNKAYKALISQKVTGNNPRRAPFEADLKSIEDLRPLVKTSEAISITGPIGGITNQYKAALPGEMMYYLQSYLKDNKDNIHNTNLVSHQTSQAFKQTSTNTPWIENPVVYMEGSDMYILVDPFEVENYTTINIEQSADETTSESNSNETVDEQGQDDENTSNSDTTENENNSDDDSSSDSTDTTDGQDVNDDETASDTSVSSFIYITYIKTPELFEVEEVVDDQGQDGGDTPNPNPDPNPGQGDQPDQPIEIRIQVGDTPAYQDFSSYGITQQILEAACDGQYSLILVSNNQETPLQIKRYSDLTELEVDSIQDYIERLRENGINYAVDGNDPATCYYGIYQGEIVAMFSTKTSRITN